MFKKITVRWLVICVALQCSAVVLGDADNKRMLSLHEAITQTIEYNPDLRAFEFQLKAQQGRVQQAGKAPSPELSIELEDVLGTGRAKGVDAAQTTISIGWVLERGVRQRYVDAARAGSSLIEVEADMKKLEAAAETARRYLVSMAFQARKHNALETIVIAEETIKSVSKRVKAGKTPRADLYRAQAELARANLQNEDIDHELLSANRRLAAQWGETEVKFSGLTGDITHPIQVASLETLKAQLPQNLEFTRLLSEQLLKKAELQLALARDKPSWHVSAGLRRNNNTSNQAFVAGISIPIGKATRNPGRIIEARANLARVNQEQDATRIRIETTLYVIYEKLQHSLHVSETVRDEIIPPLQQALIETRRAYKLGRYSYLALQSVQAELLDAKNTLIEASIDAHRNMIEIERLTGVTIVRSTTLIKQPNS